MVHNTVGDRAPRHRIDRVPTIHGNEKERKKRPVRG